ncbi:MAG TPA: hypothetical protein VKG44_10330, partial [Candidatus Baltobacteraceae bacterium]|nr:hypothetical protein [Candidatus Baltobacteraceae bacterium]
VPHSRHQIPVNYIGFQFLAGAMSRIGRGNGYLNYGVQGEYFSKTVNAPANLIKLIPFAGYALRVL